MDFGFGRWLRRTFRDTAQAGWYDALFAQKGDQELSTEEAAAAYREIVEGEPPSPPQVTEPPRPQLPAADADGTGQPNEPVKRGPGRPRKFQDPQKLQESSG